jgi:hypothetical protein
MLPVPGGRPLEIAHSPLARTTETAALVAAAIAAGGAEADDGAPVGVRPEAGILEIGQGDWEGETHDEIAHRWTAELARGGAVPTRRGHRAASRWPRSRRARPALPAILERLGATIPGAASTGPRWAAIAAPGPTPASRGRSSSATTVFKVVLLTLFDIPLSRFWTFSFAGADLGRGVPRRACGPAAHNLTEHPRRCSTRRPRPRRGADEVGRPQSDFGLRDRRRPRRNASRSRRPEAARGLADRREAIAAEPCAGVRGLDLRLATVFRSAVATGTSCARLFAYS